MIQSASQKGNAGGTRQKDNRALSVFRTLLLTGNLEKEKRSLVVHGRKKSRISLPHGNSSHSNGEVGTVRFSHPKKKEPIGERNGSQVEGSC